MSHGKVSRDETGGATLVDKMLTPSLDSQLMEKDEMSNLGFHEEDTTPRGQAAAAGTADANAAGKQGQPERERATMARIV